jgi:hypothetical protein
MSVQTAQKASANSSVAEEDQSLCLAFSKIINSKWLDTLW